MRFTAFLFAGYLALGSLFPGADFSQLPRMGEAYWHFQEHREEARSTGDAISYLEFVKIHFLQPGAHKSSHNHHDLPLHCIDHLHASILDIPAARDFLPVCCGIIGQPSLFFFHHPIGDDFRSLPLQPPSFTV